MRILIFYDPTSYLSSITVEHAQEILQPLYQDIIELFLFGILQAAVLLTICHLPSAILQPMLLQACSVENMTKTEIYWGLQHIHIFFFLTSLLIFEPCLEVLLFTNHHFKVCIFKYHTSSRIFSLKILL